MQAAQLAATRESLKYSEKGDFDRFAEDFDSEMRFQVRPASVAHALGISEAGWTKDEFVAFIKSGPSRFKSLHYKPITEFVQGEDKLAIHMTAEGIVLDGVSFSHKYTMFIDFNPGTTKVIKVFEMADSGELEITEGKELGTGRR